MDAIQEQEKKSTHKVEVVPITMEKHPNADTLSIVRVYGYSVCVRTSDWQNIPLGAYIPPDSTVDVKRPEFTFLSCDAKENGRARVKAKRLRGIQSFGLLVPAPKDTKPGDDVTELLDVQHYEPAIAAEQKNKDRLYMGGEVASGPDVRTVKYDVDAFRRYYKVFNEGEQVIITEKLDGASAKYVYSNGKMHCSSRTEWKKEYPDFSHVTLESLLTNGVPEERAKEILDRLQNKPKPRNMWWEILSRLPALEEFCKKNPDMVVYGECYGNIGRIKYGIDNTFAAFDIMYAGEWLNGQQAREMLEKAGVPCVPLIGVQNYNFDEVCKLADGNTLVVGSPAGTIREGVVIKPLQERRDPHTGRVQLKCVSAIYLEKY